MTNKLVEQITITSEELKEISKERIAGWESDLIQNAKIMVIGAGALGNEVLKNLALIGVENIVLVDFDIVEKTNLAKSVLYRKKDCTGDQYKVEIAAKRLTEMNSDMKVMTINGDATIDIGWGLVGEMDVVISCLDNRLTRQWVNRMCFAMQKSWVDGGILNMQGQVDVYRPGINCYECGLGPKALANIRYRNSCLQRMKRYASSGLANTNTIVASIVGAIQVQEALKIIASPEKSLVGSQFYFVGTSNYYDVLPRKTPRRKGCFSHVTYDPIIKSPELSTTNTIKYAISWLQNYFDDENVLIALHYFVILSVVTTESQKEKKLVKPRPLIRENDYEAIREIEGEDITHRKKTENIDKDFPYPEMTLKEIGIPHYHVMKIISRGKEYYVELTGDQEIMDFFK